MRFPVNSLLIIGEVTTNWEGVTPIVTVVTFSGLQLNDFIVVVHRNKWARFEDLYGLVIIWQNYRVILHIIPDFRLYNLRETLLLIEIS